MPKKKPSAVESRLETRTRRAASKEALKQMQKLTKSEVVDEPETLEILSDDEVSRENCILPIILTRLFCTRCLLWKFPPKKSTV